MESESYSNMSCSLTPEQLLIRRQKLVPSLFKRAEQVTDIPNGIRFRFASRPGLLIDLAHIIEQEQDCCSFLRFELITEPSAGPITLDVTGRPGTGHMLRSL